ncbi:hypothetical protein LAZ67_1001595 [Cordylochernes scorpioides]|uniref:Uncharacterized protein n=1 Tax=Cordylochernes scorpioides TaxID=51811 RepID=A0ABY6K083_9ARAC|nr:hypothetical protein LAZ67_1001595 [Cordylochernes scorpioides]
MDEKNPHKECVDEKNLHRECMDEQNLHRECRDGKDPHKTRMDEKLTKRLNERVRSDLHDLKMTILIWKKKKDPDATQRQGSMKIQHKLKSNSQNHLESLNQPLSIA